MYVIVYHSHNHREIIQCHGALWRWLPSSALVQIMACRLTGAKPLPATMLTYCQMHREEQNLNQNTTISFKTNAVLMASSEKVTIMIKLPWCANTDDDVIKWKHFTRNCPFMRGIHRSPMTWRRALMFSLICVWINDWVNNRKAGDLKRYRAHFDVIVMAPEKSNSSFAILPSFRSRETSILVRLACSWPIGTIKIHLILWMPSLQPFWISLINRRNLVKSCGI